MPEMPAPTMSTSKCSVLIGPGNLPELETALEQAERRLTPTLQQAALGFVADAGWQAADGGLAGIRPRG